MLKVFGVILTLLVILVAVASTSMVATTAFAQNSGTPVLIKGDDGVYYLSTEVKEDTTKGGENATSSTVIIDSNEDATVIEDNTRPMGNRELQNVDIRVPQGFAQTFSGLLNGLLSFVLIISALLVLFFLISGGFDWITSGGDKGKTEKARSKIVAAVIGIVIVASSFAILQLVIRFLGFTSLEDVFQSAGTINGGAEPAPAATPTPLPTPTPTPTLQ